MGELFLNLLIRMGGGGGLLVGHGGELGDLCGGGGLPAGRVGALNSLLAHTAFQVFSFEKNNWL